MYLRFTVLDFPFSICSRNAFACDCCVADRIAFRNRDSFSLAAATNRSAF